jgi:hypothetical protein
MVTYQIQISDSKHEAFSEIMKSLKNLGVVNSYDIFENLAGPGIPLDTEELLNILKKSEQQAKEDTLIPSHQAAAFVKQWRQKNM